MRIGVSTCKAVADSIDNRGIRHLDFSDNPITDYAMHRVRDIVAKLEVQSLNMASTMMSGEGFELLMEELVKHPYLKSLDIGRAAGSDFKNSLGVQGAVMVSAFLIKNDLIESLNLDDNAIGPDGGECIGIALSQNSGL